MAADGSSEHPIEAKAAALTSAVFKLGCEFGEAVFANLAGISELEDPGPAVHGASHRRFGGQTKRPTVTLSGPLPPFRDSQWLWTWHARARTSAPETFQDTTLSLYAADDDLAAPPRLAYLLKNAFPTKVEIVGAESATEVVLRKVTLQCDDIYEGGIPR